MLANIPIDGQAAAYSFANVLYFAEADRDPSIPHELNLPPFDFLQVSQAYGPLPNRGRMIGGAKLIVKPDKVVTATIHEVGEVVPGSDVHLVSSDEAVTHHYKKGASLASAHHEAWRTENVDILRYHLHRVLDSPYLPLAAVPAWPLR
jgi:hypothetical protein